MEDVSKTFVDEFFRASTLPATTHQEWLLRMHSRLMKREAILATKEEQLSKPNLDATGRSQ